MKIYSFGMVIRFFLQGKGPRTFSVLMQVMGENRHHAGSIAAQALPGKTHHRSLQQHLGLYDRDIVGYRVIAAQTTVRRYRRKYVPIGGDIPIFRTTEL